MSAGSLVRLNGSSSSRNARAPASIQSLFVRIFDTSTSGSGFFFFSDSQYPGGSLSGRYTGYVRRLSPGTA